MMSCGIRSGCSSSRDRAASAGSLLVRPSRGWRRCSCLAEGWREKYRERMASMVARPLSWERSTRRRPSSRPTARADRPDCGMIWYEGCSRATTRRSIPRDSGRSTRSRPESGFVMGQEGGGLPPLEPGPPLRAQVRGLRRRAPARTVLRRQLESRACPSGEIAGRGRGHGAGGAARYPWPRASLGIRTRLPSVSPSARRLAFGSRWAVRR